MSDRLTAREKEILAILKKNPMLAQDGLAEQLHIIGRGYIFDEHSGMVVVGKARLDVNVAVAPSPSETVAFHARRFGADDSRPGLIKLSGAGNGYLLSLELARRHLEPVLLTFLGRDEIGDRMLDALLGNGVNVQNIFRSHEIPTGKRLVFSSTAESTMLIKDDVSELPLGLDAISSKEDLIKNTRILLIDGELPLKTVSYLVSIAVSNNIVVSVIGWPLCLLRKQGLLAYSRFFLVYTAKELSVQLQSDLPAEPEELFPACRKIVGEGCYALVVLFEDQGLILATAEETVYLPASPLQEPGTAMSVVAGIVEGLTSGFRIRMAVRRAMGNTAVDMRDER
jgi:pseudouridine kinase